MRNTQSLPLVITMAMVIVAPFTAGCRSTGNLYDAESMPESLRIASRANPRESNLSRLAGELVGGDTINSGDVLRVSLAAGLSAADIINLDVRVSDDGTVLLSEVGRISVSGLEPEAAAAAIQTACIQKDVIRNPAVTVTRVSQKTNTVRVFGGVRKEGAYQLPAGSSDLLSAIISAGGLAEDAGSIVEIRTPGEQFPAMSPPVADADSDGIRQVGFSRPTSGRRSGSQTYRVNLVSAVQNGSGAHQLSDGSVVMVERRDPAPVHVMGLVRKSGPQDYPVGKDLRLLDVISRAGGLSNQLADRVFIIRPLSNSPDPAVITVSLRKAKKSSRSNVLLAPGDTVSVEITPTTILLDTLQLIRFGMSSNVAAFF